MNPRAWTVWLILILAALGLGAPAARADFKAGDWQYYGEVRTPDPGLDGFVAVPVDVKVYAHCRSGLEDLRVIGPNGEETPYVILIRRAQSKTLTYQPEILNRALAADQPRDSDAPYVLIIPRDRTGQATGNASMLTPSAAAGGWQEFVVDFGRPGRKNNRLELVIPGHNFRRPARVYGSDDAVTWKLIQDRIGIFDFSGDVHVRELTLNYPENIFRYLKVELGLKPDEEPLDVQGVEIKYTETEPAVTMTYAPMSLSQREAPELKVTDLSVDLGGDIPVNKIVIAVNDPEFYRRVQVMDPEFKQVKAEGTIYRYSLDGAVSERLDLDLGELRLGKFGLRIINRDNRALDVTGLRAEGDMRVVVFRPPPLAAAKLYFGNPQAKKPVYDLEVLYPEVSRTMPPLGVLSQALANPEFRPPDTTPPRDYTWAIWLVLVLAVGVMAWLMFNHVRQIKDN